jgi:hypothetical protein
LGGSVKLKCLQATIETDCITAASPYKGGLMLYLVGAHRIMIRKTEPAYAALKEWHSGE